jgi:hypothetical protein
MQEDVLIHKTSGQKVCNIEEHYGLATIEFNPVEITHAAVEKNVSLMAKPLTKEDALELKENLSIVAKEDVSTEEKMDTEQKDDAPILKNPDTDSVLVAVAAAEAVPSGEGKLVDHQELFGSAISASDWLKSVPDNLKWMDQKEDLIQSTNDSKKRRSLVSKKRCKKRRFKISKSLNGASKNRF